MLKGLYTSALGLGVLKKRQEVAANNIANVNSVGFKRETAVAGAFPAMLVHRLHDPSNTGDKPPLLGQLSLGVQLSDIVTDYSKGVHKETGNPFQAAVVGEGYFTVRTPGGDRYTRNGEFSLGPNGVLQTSDGYPVMGQQGEIVITGGKFEIDGAGNIYGADGYVDRLRIVTLNGPVFKEGSSLFRGDNPQDMETPQILQGSVEESNANPIYEMVNMINIMRAYEAGQKVVQTHDATLEKAVNEIGRL